MKYILFGGRREDAPSSLQHLLDTGEDLDTLLLPLSPDFSAEVYIESSASQRMRRLHDATTQWVHMTTARPVEWWQVLNTHTGKLATYGGQAMPLKTFPPCLIEIGSDGFPKFERAPVPSVSVTEDYLMGVLSVLSQEDCDDNPQQQYVNRRIRHTRRNAVNVMAEAVRAFTMQPA